MNSKEFKKLTDQNKNKLNTNERSIKLKEAEKHDKKKELDGVYAEKQNAKEKIDELKRKRIEITDEINRLETNLKQNKNEMNRKKADCIYKTKQQYEEMIRMYENEMKLKKTYSRSDESRLLEDIRIHKKGIETLAEFEKLKNICDQLQEMLNAKKTERDRNWAEFSQYKDRLNSHTESIGRLKTEYVKIDTDLKELIQKKVELKKSSEDLARENLVKKQTLKKVVAENFKKQRKIKELTKPDETLVKIDENLRDLDKLINYFKKLPSVNDSNESPESSFNLENNSSYYSSLPYPSSSFNNKRIQANHIVSTSSSSSSLVSLPSNVPLFVQEMEQNRTKSITRPNRINLSASLGFQASDTPSPAAFLGTFNVNTPIDGQETQQGHFHMKQKVDDDIFAKSMGAGVNRKRMSKKSKSKASTPASHCVDVINLLVRMEIPIQLSSQPDECLQELKTRKEKLLNEQKIYKENQLANKSSKAVETKTTIADIVTQLTSFAAAASAASTATTNNNTPQETQTNSDTKSEISSCLDSNYESDNNVNGGKTSSAVSFCYSEEIENERAEAIGLALPKLRIGDLERQITITNSLTVTNSDDSDVTVNEAPVISKKKEEQHKSSNEMMSKESSSPSKTPTTDVSLVALNFQHNKSSDGKVEPPKTLMRMNSDGYCSSCTPLSASSINNENPNKNPFFQTNGENGENAKDLHL